MITRNPVSMAVIGAGYWGRKVARETLELSRTTDCVKLHSIVDNSLTMLESCKNEFGDLDYRLDWRTVLKDPELSAVHVCTPNQTHFDIASKFLEAGKHVLVEKPLALRSEEAYELVQLARENGRILSAGHVHRFNNGVKALKQVMAKGTIGEPYYIRMRWTGLLPQQTQRDIVSDLAPHPFDISNNLLGKWPTKITCKGQGYRTREVEDVAFITAEHMDGFIVNTEVSWLDPEKKRQVTLVGNKGTAELDCLDQKITLRTQNSTTQLASVPSNTLRTEISHFADCARRSQQSEPFTNHSDGVLGAQVVRLLEASRQSMYQGRTVTVEPTLAEKILAQ